MVKIIEGNLLDLAEQGKFDVILHGCNCFHTMGGGIARQIAQRYPGAQIIDAQTTYGEKAKLGTFTQFLVDKYNSNLVIKSDGTGSEGFIILNCYTQFNMSTGEDVFEYASFNECLERVKRLFSGKRIGMPKIGAGLAGGNWDVIYKIIQNQLGDEDVTIVIYKK